MCDRSPSRFTHVPSCCAAGLQDVRLGIGYFEYGVNDGTTGAAGHGLTASYDKVSVRGILSALGGRSGTTDHCRTLTCTSSRTRPMCMILGLESGISSMISTVVPLERQCMAFLFRLHLFLLKPAMSSTARATHSTLSFALLSLSLIRLSQAMTCRTSDTIVEIILEIPDSNPNIMHIGRVSDGTQVGVRQ